MVASLNDAYRNMAFQHHLTSSLAYLVLLDTAYFNIFDTAWIIVAFTVYKKAFIHGIWIFYLK